MPKYFNSFGSVVKRFEMAEAVGILLDLAKDNQLTDSQVENEIMQKMQQQQQEAFETVETVLERYEDELNNLGVPNNFSEPQIIPTHLNTNPREFEHAMTIVYQLASENMPDLADASSLEVASILDRQQLALDIMPKFLALHGKTINKWETLPAPHI